MTQSRHSQVSLSDTPYYHCISRCVRRAYLCGEDKLTQTSFEHRRHWVVERMHFLASVFTINIAAYAVMSNHYHLVLHIDELNNQSLTDEEVCHRWSLLYSKPVLIERWLTQQHTPQRLKMRPRLKSLIGGEGGWGIFHGLCVV